MKPHRRRLADGTVKVYWYDRKRPKRRSRTIAGTLGALIQEYRKSPEFQSLRPNTRKVYERAIGHMHGYYEAPLDEIRRRHIINLRNGLAEKSGIANQVVQVFSVLMEFAIQMEYRETNPALRIKRLAKREYDRWSDDQVDYALDQFPEWGRRAVLLALYTGQRASDVIRMPWSDYDGEGIQVAQEKTGAKLWVPCHEVLQGELAAWKEQRSAVTILTGASGRSWVRPQSFATAFSALMRKHGAMDGLVFHGLRKTAAAKLAEAGCSSLEIAAITGHKSLAMIELYTRQADQKRRAKAAVIKLENARKT